MFAKSWELSDGMCDFVKKERQEKRDLEKTPRPAWGTVCGGTTVLIVVQRFHNLHGPLSGGSYVCNGGQGGRGKHQSSYTRWQPGFQDAL